MNKNKITMFFGIFVIVAWSLIVVSCISFVQKKHDDKLAKLQKELHNEKALREEQEDVISSLNEQLKEQCNYECNCGWYEDFYYEHKEEIGAYE